MFNCALQASMCELIFVVQGYYGCEHKCQCGTSCTDPNKPYSHEGGSWTDCCCGGSFCPGTIYECYKGCVVSPETYALPNCTLHTSLSDNSTLCTPKSNRLSTRTTWPNLSSKGEFIFTVFFFSPGRPIWHTNATTTEHVKCLSSHIQCTSLVN